jgi:hypothetical protein
MRARCRSGKTHVTSATTRQACCLLLAYRLLKADGYLNAGDGLNADAK